MWLIAQRLGSVIPVLIGVSLSVFLTFAILPGDAAEQLLGADAAPERVEELRAELNLDRPAWKRYVEWIAGLLRGDLGESLANSLPVTTLLSDRLPVSIELLAYTLVIALGLSIPAALLAAHRPGGFADKVCTIASMVALSVPNYVLAILFVFVFAVTFRIFPTLGFTPIDESFSNNVRSLTLPALAIAFPLFGLYTQFLRRDLVDQMQREAYVVTAAAKGIGPWRVLVRHALRNSLFGLLTVVGLHLGTLIGGMVVIEQVFALPGVGQLLLQAINTRDIGVVQAIVLLLAGTTVLANVTVDLLYAVLDPRIHYGGR
jgi:peptide/nickel transport system permease protein